MKPVSDPAILQQLNGGGGLKPVTDPAILMQLGGETQPTMSEEQALTGPQPQKPQRTLAQDAGSFFGGMRQSLYDIPQSIVELGARGTDALGISKGAYPLVHQGFSEEVPKGDPAFNMGRIEGQIGTTLPLSGLKVLQGAGALPRIVNGAAQGLGASALTSNNSDAPLGAQLGAGAGAGAALPLLGAAGKAVGNAVPTVLGNLTTGAGANSVREAFQAGKAGGAASDAFTGSLRGTTPWAQVVDDAKTALGKLRAEKGAEYRAGMAQVSKDKTVLDFAPIDAAMAKAAAVKNFKGQALSPKTADVRKEIDDAIAHWKKLDPAEYHTPEGFDALKQQIGDIKDSLPYNTPQRAVADQAYNAIRAEIAAQAPTYSKVMSKYSEASDVISDIQRELSLGPKGNPNTALRKLQSIMRDNVNTSFGDRAKYGKALEGAGATNLMPALAGQSLSSALPRGLAKYGDMGLAAAATLHNPSALMALPLASPRVVGEGAHALGATARNVQGLLAPLPQLPRGVLSPGLGLLAPGLLYQGAQ